MLPRISAIQINVVPAFLLRGSLKAVMPFEMASTPVRAVVPLAKAFRIKKKVNGCSTVSTSCGGSIIGPKVPVK